MRTLPDSPQLVIAMRLLDHLKLCGFEFQRTASGEDGPLVGHRVSDDWVDTIHIEGFSRDCFASRKRTCSLIVASAGLVERRAHGSALTVLNDVLTWERNVNPTVWRRETKPWANTTTKKQIDKRQTAKLSPTMSPTRTSRSRTRTVTSERR